MPTIDGVVSGIDTTSLINAITTARQVSIDTLKAHAADFDAQREAVAGVKNRFQALSDAIGAIDSTSKFTAYSAKTNSSAFTVSASNGAVAGVYDVFVQNLASAQSSSSQGYADKTTDVFSAGTFQVTVGGDTTAVTLDSDHLSLEDMADALNQVPGLAAYVIDTGGASDRYRLMVQGTTPGAAGAFSADFSGIGTGPTLTNNTTAVDATVVIGGVTVHSASNTLSGAIPGVRIELVKENTAAERVTVDTDVAATRDRLKAVVDAYNTAVSYYSSYSAYDREKNIAGPLVGEATTRRAVDDIGRMVSNAFTVGGTDLKGLSSLGITTSRDGTLEFDTAVFEEKFTADPESVETFLTSADGPLLKLKTKIDDFHLDSQTGSLVSRGKSLDSSISDLNDQIDVAEERMAAETSRLRAQFTAMESILSKLQTTSGYLTSMFASSSSSSKSA